MQSSVRIREDRWVGASIGAIGAVAIGGLLGAARDQIGTTSSALVFAIVVVFAASVGGRLAGVVTSVAAALAFDFFLIPPYYTLRVDAGSDSRRPVLGPSTPFHPEGPQPFVHRDHHSWHLKLGARGVRRCAHG